MIGNFLFQETSPNAAGTVASSNAVSGGQGTGWPAGVAAPLDGFNALNIVAEITGATGGTLDLYIQLSVDMGANWYDVAHFPQATALSAVKYYDAPMSNATTNTTTTQVGKNLSPALALGSGGIGSVVNGAFSDRMRLVMVAGSGTTLGASVVVKVFAQTDVNYRS